MLLVLKWRGYFEKKKIFLFIITVVIIIGLYGFTYIPKNIISIQPNNVSKIEIFDGNRGELITISNSEQTEHIISNLNKITFKKDKPSIGYMGYKFRMTIYDDKGRKYKEIIINSNERIRYRGFFYIDESGKIDEDYINALFEKDESK